MFTFFCDFCQFWEINSQTHLLSSETSEPTRKHRTHFFSSRKHRTKIFSSRKHRIHFFRLELPRPEVLLAFVGDNLLVRYKQLSKNNAAFLYEPEMSRRRKLNHGANPLQFTTTTPGPGGVAQSTSHPPQEQRVRIPPGCKFFRKS
jgi:hypothetical protein